jgi:hypothetical protein
MIKFSLYSSTIYYGEDFFVKSEPCVCKEIEVSFIIFEKFLLQPTFG